MKTKKTKQLNIGLTEEEYTLLDIISRNKEIKITELVRLLALSIISGEFDVHIVPEQIVVTSKSNNQPH